MLRLLANLIELSVLGSNMEGLSELSIQIPLFFKDPKLEFLIELNEFRSVLI